MMLTFPVIYGLILGDFGYGLIIFLIGAYLGTKPFAADPVAKNGITILKWMGVWCIIWGLLFAEGFGFVWDESWSPLAPLYEITKDATYGRVPAFITDTLGMSHTYIPFHRSHRCTDRLRAPLGVPRRCPPRVDSSWASSTSPGHTVSPLHSSRRAVGCSSSSAVRSTFTPS